jgi:hypothetical protein
MRTQQWQLAITSTADQWLRYSVTEVVWNSPSAKVADAIILSTVNRDLLPRVADEFADWVAHTLPPVENRAQPALPGFTVRRGMHAPSWSPRRT